MKALFHFGNRYAENSTWKDFALVKLCLCAIGILIGTGIPEEKKLPVRLAAGGVFAVTYAVLMKGAIALFRAMRSES